MLHPLDGDLAGLEMVRKTGASGITLKEAKTMNKSLHIDLIVMKLFQHYVLHLELINKLKQVIFLKDNFKIFFLITFKYTIKNTIT